MSHNYVDGKRNNLSTAREQYRSVSVIPLADVNAFVVATASAGFSIRLDEVSSSVTYVGRAAIGSSEAAAVWSIMKIGVSGTVTSITYADSDLEFDNIWANRASLTYG